MKQVLIRDGGVAVEEVPAPGIDARSVLVRVEWSCVSVGTERAGIAMSGLPLYRRALKQPEHVRRAIEVARDQGLVRTFKRVRSQLASGLPTGYSCAGVVVEAGEEVSGFAPGDRVACAGAGMANHAELVSVPVNLVARVPDGLGLDDASTVTLGAIALQGVRRAEPTLGETVVVIGLGVLGQLTAQLLQASGCRVVGTDLDAARVAVAAAGGLGHAVGPGDDLAERVGIVSDGFGADAVVITAASQGDEIVRLAAGLCRKKGRIVIVGDVGLGLRRSDIYEKELDVLMSTSYGPGRYDETYEVEGRDYPIGYVRWTENRNLEEYLRLLGEGRVSIAGLPTERYPVDDAVEAYAALERDADRPLVVLLGYPERAEAPSRTTQVRIVQRAAGRIQVALVGAGSFTQGTHLPNLLALDDSFQIRCVMSRTGATAKAVAGRASAAYATTDYDQVLADPEVDLVLVATRHDLHAPLALAALEAGKHVFVEKPLALSEGELARFEAFYEDREGPLLLTGFNRRFSPAATALRELLAGRESPLVADYRMNAGYIPLESWVHGPEGGGRNIGEACHIYDLFTSLTGSTVTAVSAHGIRPSTRRFARNDNFVATIEYADGSVCTLTYTALGSRDHPKERLEVFAEGRVLSLDDYKSVSVTGGGTSERRKAGGGKGHVEELRAVAACLREGGAWPITLAEQLEAMRTAFAVEEQLQ
jgi:predicted dehydrogenase/threonine dehydrogenase-like Zn-dependent dehydrogenase